jgi:hypothetical protein
MFPPPVLQFKADVGLVYLHNKIIFFVAFLIGCIVIFQSQDSDIPHSSTNRQKLFA